MISLMSTLNTASEALMAQEAEISVTNNNIANASTAGYTRETVSLQEAAPTSQGALSVGNGVEVAGITSVRNELLTSRIQQQTSEQGSSDAQVTALTQIQTLFPSTGTSLASSLSGFFTSLSALSSNPTDAANRQTVLSSAQTLVQQFNSVSAGLSGPASSLNTTVKTDVAQINELSSEAASLNQQITSQSATGQSSGTLTDQLGQVETQLASLTNISVTHGTGGDTITTGNGTPLVLAGQSHALQTSTGSDGNTHILDSSGTDITSAISSGDLGGTIQIRDTVLPGLQTSLDTLANQFATAFNSAQASGYTQNGTAGAALFSIPTTVAGSAAAISLTTTDPTAIAASSDGSSGSSGNVANLVALQNSALPSGQSVTTGSANLVYQIGNLTSNATTQQSSISLSLSSLTTQQSSVSGVSIDEESANLIRYQQAYEAAAKVVSTISTLFDTTINMISGS
ncbi:flagellar hook-associated protein FlgK [Granulicella tundricola]|uniref:Flagellar hook-associated protein 1 n=1 Tax=Granulicella tundricola (strain ATCC BAA-1859 / DSM 23138 / MP5ACTX9) TaxID=1198114 RepID=E8X615_GRATM|nr:flagellar hook-associated protein FlgK [Granulicella tundricola]ADW70899.1 flagellar hook-associated protein FlgK [Granulicella tundricola MP5ACTX9]